VIYIIVILISSLYPSPEMTYNAVVKDPNTISLLIKKYEQYTGRVGVGILSQWWTWKHDPKAVGVRGIKPGPWPSYPLQMGDINHDQRVDLLDFAILSRRYPTGGIAGSYVPVEPNVPPQPVIRETSVDPNNWSLEQKGLYMQLIILLGE
jgi:hypothetical protein